MPIDFAQARAEKNAIGPAQTYVERYAFQSTYSTTLLQFSILTQDPSQRIVGSTLKDVQQPGYGVALAPYSEVPVAVQFNVAGSSGSSTTFVLKPGEVLHPFGDRPFTGFQWGLPFGWLGGGVASLIVLRAPESRVLWTDDPPEILFHRATYEVKQPADLTAAGSYNNAPANWPARFPWPSAARGAGGVNAQDGQPLLAVTPTRTVMELRSSLAAGASLAAAKMRVLFQSMLPIGDTVGFTEITWPAWTNLGTSGNLSTANPILDFTSGPIVRLHSDTGGILLVDASGAATLSGMFVDICRYGRL